MHPLKNERNVHCIPPRLRVDVKKYCRCDCSFWILFMKSNSVLGITRPGNSFRHRLASLCMRASTAIRKCRYANFVYFNSRESYFPNYSPIETAAFVFQPLITTLQEREKWDMLINKRGHIRSCCQHDMCCITCWASLFQNNRLCVCSK